MRVKKIILNIYIQFILDQTKFLRMSFVSRTDTWNYTYLLTVYLKLHLQFIWNEIDHGVLFFLQEVCFRIALNEFDNNKIGTI